MTAGTGRKPRMRYPVEIHEPLEPDPYGVPANWPVDAQHNITASGDIDDSIFQSIQSVRGRVGTYVDWQPGQFQGLEWSFPAVNYAEVGVRNTFFVEVVCLPKGSSGETETHCASRDFMGVTATSGGPWVGGVHPGWSLEFHRVLPRYYRLRIHPQASGARQDSPGFLMGGLWQQNSIFLAYDLQASTPQEPVWRDINLPESVGRWTLRLYNTPSGIVAQLTFQSILPNQVPIPVTFRSDRWNLLGNNQLTAAGGVASWEETSLPGGRNLVVEVEPA